MFYEGLYLYQKRASIPLAPCISFVFLRSTTATPVTVACPGGKKRRHIITDPITFGAEEIESSRIDRRQDIQKNRFYLSIHLVLLLPTMVLFVHIFAELFPYCILLLAILVRRSLLARRSLTEWGNSSGTTWLPLPLPLLPPSQFLHLSQASQIRIFTL